MRHVASILAVLSLLGSGICWIVGFVVIRDAPTAIQEIAGTGLLICGATLLVACAAFGIYELVIVHTAAIRKAIEETRDRGYDMVDRLEAVERRLKATPQADAGPYRKGL